MGGSASGQTAAVGEGSQRRRLIADPWSLVVGLAVLSTFPIAWFGHDQILAGNGDNGVCFYRNLTGHNCPFCGLTRAFAHVSHGEWSAAQAMNPWLWLVVLLVIGIGSALVADAFTAWGLRSRLRRFFLRRWWFILIIILLLCLLRSLTGV